MLYAIVALLVIILDQWMKYWVAGNIALGTEIKELIPGVLSLVNIHNDGAAFSFLSGGNARIYFIIICAVFTIAVIVALATNLISGSLGRWSAIFVMAGGIGNCIDRILYGFVQDMFKLEFINFPIFNVADIFITVFCLVFILYILFGGEKSARKRGRDEDEFADDDDEDEEEEEVKPSRRKAAAFDDDDEEEDEPIRPVFKRRQADDAAPRQPVRKPRQPKYEQDYEQFKAARAARQQQAPSIPVQSAPVVDPSDPFAEWERANSRVEAQKNASVPAQKPSVPQPAPAPAARPVASAAPAQAPTPAPTSKAAPSVPSAPAKKASDGLDFDLEDILNEFK